MKLDHTGAILKQIKVPEYSTPIMTYETAVYLGMNVVEGQISATLFGNTYTQFVKNGNFTNGTTGWNGAGATLVANNNTLIATGTGSNIYVEVNQTTEIIPITGKRIFIRAKVKVTNSNASQIALRLRGSSSGTGGGAMLYVAGVNNPVENNIYILSGITTLTEMQTGFVIVRADTTYPDVATANGKTTEVTEFMAIDLDQNPTLIGLTTDQINQRIPHWFDVTKSTLCGGQRMRSTGKNLFDKKLYETIIEDGRECIRTTAFAGGASAIRVKGVKWKDNKQYAFQVSAKRSSGDVSIRVFYKDGTSQTILSGNVSNFSSFTGVSQQNKSIDYVTFGSNATTDAFFDVDTFQIEESTVVTSYESFKDGGKRYHPLADAQGNIIYLRSLPNNVKDEISDDGKLTKRVSEPYALKSDDITQLTITNENVDIVRLENIFNTLSPKPAPWQAGVEGKVTISNMAGEIAAVSLSSYTTQDINKFATVADGRIWIIVEKGKYTDLTAAKIALTGMTVNYQLEKEQTTQFNGIETLIAYPGGHLFIEPVIRMEEIYSANGISVVPECPIKTIESVWKVVGNTYTPVDLSKVVVAADKLSFTITGAIVGEKYRYTYEYPSELTTTPLLQYSFPINVAATISDIAKLQARLSAELGDVWMTLLPLADKELSMYTIASIATPASATIEQVATKVNEIINKWK